jgi:hypothetical protein
MVIRHKPSCPFVIATGFQSLKDPAIATSVPPGASKLNMTDFFAGERIRLCGLSAGGVSLRRGAVFDFDVFLLVEMVRESEGHLGLVEDRPGLARPVVGLVAVVRFDVGPRLCVLPAMCSLNVKSDCPSGPIRRSCCSKAMPCPATFQPNTSYPRLYLSDAAVQEMIGK